METAHPEAASSPPADQAPARVVPPLRRRAQRPRSSGNPPAARLLAGVVFVAVLAWFGLNTARGIEVGIGLVMVPLITVAMFPWLARVARRETRFDLLGLLFLGLFLRFFGAFFRFQNAADAVEYHNVGNKLAVSFRQLDFGVDTGRQIPGTGSLRYLSGLVSVVTGPNMFAQFLVFTVIAFIGAVLFYLAFVTGFPEGDHRRYALFILLWPSLAFWPSSVGKEAAMSFGIGLLSLGAARLYSRKRGGSLVFAVGLTAVVMIRPHIGLTLLIAAFVAYLFINRTGASRSLGFGKLFLSAIMLVAGLIVAGSTANFLGLETLGSEEISTSLENTAAQTSQGGGEFTPIRASNPLLYGGSLVTVLFRPFPFETHNLESVLTSIESTFLIALIIASARRLRRLPRYLLRQPYVAYAFSTVLLFGYLFSVVSNFGILARQRTQVLPLLFVLLSVPAMVRGDPPPDPQRRQFAPRGQTAGP
jgi:hypothetical protein